MIICRVCGEECEEGLEMCPVCGAELELQEEEIITNEEADEVEIIIEIKNPVLAASVEDVVTAEIFKDTLKENGIAYSSGEQEFSMRVTFGGGFAKEDIYVDEENLEQAQAIYDEILNAEPQFDDEFFDEEFEEDI